MSLTTPTALSTLQRIRQKVRRLTASPSQNQITDNEIDDYLNSFIVFDFPESVRLFNLREEYDFYTDPNVDAYNFPRNDFFNIYQPVYIAGYQSFYTQSREQFFRIYPQLEFSQDVATGDGVAATFSFQLNNFPVMRAYQYQPDATVFSRVFVSFTDANGNSVVSRDDGVGAFLTEDGANPVLGSIDYVTGAVTGLSFGAPLSIPPNGATITAQYVSYQASRPQALLFYNNTLFLRPIPDKAYKVTMEVLKQPSMMLLNGDNPALEEWWEYYSFGTAKKILEDRQDITSLANIVPMFKEKEILVLRRTTDQLAQERVATIYTEQVTYPYGNFFNRF